MGEYCGCLSSSTILAPRFNWAMEVLSNSAPNWAKAANSLYWAMSSFNFPATFLATKKVAGKLKLDMAQYNELAAFAQFGAELDKTSMAQLNRGAKMVELLKQPQYSPMLMEDQVASVFAGINGYLDNLSMEKVRPFESGLISHLKANHPGILKDIREKNDLSDDTKGKLTAA